MSDRAVTVLQVDFDGGGSSPMGDERVGFSAATDIDREHFGLTWNVAPETGGLLVGKTARIEIGSPSHCGHQSRSRLTDGTIR
jgi:polyisoprenoid-binding protein YceI